MRIPSVLCGLAAVLLLAAPGSMSAWADSKSEPRQLAQFEHWSAYRVIDQGKKVCYMAAQPTGSQGLEKKDHRGDVYALITDRPSDNSRNVFSYITGYTYKSGSDVTVTIDKQRFNLFTRDDSAWAPDGATDAKIADAIRRGHSMTVTGTAAHGEKTTDTFDLGGAKGALQAIGKECSSS